MDFAGDLVQPEGKTMNHKLKKSLLATSCLTAISVGGAQAAIVNESSVANGDFGNTRQLANILPSNTTQINGGIPSNAGDFADYFAVSGLTPGTQVTVRLGAATGATQSFLVYTTGDYDSGSTNISSVAPATFTVSQFGSIAFGANTEGSPGTYSIFIDTPQANVPVAPSIALLGIGAAAGIRRRKHGVKK
jgi:hypothetical protein